MPKTASNFLPAHAVTYGLNVTVRHPKTSRVVSFVCRFCTVFGRQEKVGGKRARTNNVKYFSTFRADGYKRHLCTAHAEKWAEYQKLEATEEKDQFFTSVPVAFVNSMDAHVDREDHIRVLINAQIVDEVIGELSFHPDDLKSVTRERALNMFKKLEQPSPGNGALGQRDVYEVVIKTRRRFELCIKFVGCGASFRMAARLMDCTQAESGMSVYGGCSDVIASNYTRIVCASALQILSNVLRQVWAFSIALDGSTHQGMSYLDVRIRFEWKGKLLNFHFMAVPLFERHTGENMFQVLKRFLDAVVSNSWSKECIAVSTDGAKSMTGRVQGLVTRILDCCPTGTIRIWCGLHQLDLVMQRVFKPALENEFYSTLTALIGHLRRQANLISEMRSTCPKVADVRWISMYSSTKWLVDNRIRVQQHLEEKAPPCAPNKMWWVFLHAINAFIAEAKAVFVSLQGLTTIVSEQRIRLQGLVDTYCRMSGMQGPLLEDQIDEIAVLQPTERSGKFIITHEHVRSCIDGLGLWMIEAMESLEETEVLGLSSSVGKLFVEAADGISDIVCERGSSNQPNQELPPVLPHELARVDMRQFLKILQTHRDRLKPYFNDAGIELISQQFSKFVRDVREEPQFREAVVNSADVLSGFSE